MDPEKKHVKTELTTNTLSKGKKPRRNAHSCVRSYPEKAFPWEIVQDLERVGYVHRTHIGRSTHFKHLYT
jgi:hypothetical protein